MLVLEGILINVFETPKGVTKDGKEYGGESKIQVMYENTLANGEKRTEMETLTVSDTSPYLGKKNAPVRGSLPHRQLRKSISPCIGRTSSSLPHRQLRKCCLWVSIC